MSVRQASPGGWPGLRGIYKCSFSRSSSSNCSPPTRRFTRCVRSKGCGIHGFGRSIFENSAVDNTSHLVRSDARSKLPRALGEHPEMGYHQIRWRFAGHGASVPDAV